MDFLTHFRDELINYHFDFNLVGQGDIFYLFANEQIMKKIKSKIYILILELTCNISYLHNNYYDSFRFRVNGTEYYIHFYQQ